MEPSNQTSGSASHQDATQPKCTNFIDVPLVVADEENFKDFGRLVRDFDKEELWIVPWPQPDWRRLCPGTGVGGGVMYSKMLHRWNKTSCLVEIEGDKTPLLSGKLPSDVSPSNRTHVLVHEANYHPDSGQIICPKGGGPYIALLAPPGDNVKPEDFVAFYFPGSVGFQMKPRTWHQFVYPLADEQWFESKQGAVFACILLDSVKEFGKYFRVPLILDLAK